MVSNARPSGNDVVLVTEGLTKVFGEGEGQVRALSDANVSVRRGEFLTVMGPSGSGKTTLLTLMGGIDTPTSGKVLLEGEDLAAMDDDQLAVIRRQRIGFIFQSFNLLPILTAEDNVILPLVLDNMPRDKALKRAHELMTQLKIQHRTGHYPSAMSGGEQQRLAICRALGPHPPVILADEPTGNLDTARRNELTALLRQLVDEQGQTLVMVTHDINIATISDRVLILRDGQVHNSLEGKDITVEALLHNLTPAEK